MIELQAMKSLCCLAPILSISAPAALPTAPEPAPVQNVAELLPLLSGAESLREDDARALLERLPMPQQCSRPLRAQLEFCKGVQLLVCLLAPQGENSAELRARLMLASPRMWVTYMFVAMLAAEEAGDEALRDALVAETEAGMRSIDSGQGIGCVRALGLLSPEQRQRKQVDAAEEAARNRCMAEALAREANSADARLALAMMHLYEEMGVGVDVERAMQHALYGAVAEMYLLQEDEGLRNNLCLSLARAASLRGAVALPLQVAALRMMEKSKESAGLGFYRLAKLYSSLPEELSVAAEELEKAALLAGAECKGAACLHELAQRAEDEQERALLQSLAEQAKFDPEKDYLHGEHGRLASFRVSYPASALPDATEREVLARCKCLLARAAVAERLGAASRQGGNVQRMITPVLSSFLKSISEESAPATSADILERADTTEPGGEGMMRFLNNVGHELAKWEDLQELGTGVSQLSEEMSHLMQALPAQGEVPEEALAPLRKLADEGQADALYLLAAYDVRSVGAFTQENWERMVEAMRRGSAEAAWFLYSVLWEGLYGLEHDPMSASACYRLALARLSCNAWEHQLELAEGGAARLYALVHLRHAAGGEKYGIALDDALQAYAAAHNELQSIISPLRLLCIGDTLRKNSSTAEENRELRARALQLASALQPPILDAAELDFLQRQAEYSYRLERDSERASAARKALPALREARADMLLLAEGKIVHEQAGQDTAKLPSELLQGAHLVCRECDRALADFAIHAGVRSVSALRMPIAERDYLRAHNIAAGGWEILR